MAYAGLANAVAALHLAFVLFIPLGGLVALRWPRAGWLHLACAAWGALIVWTPLVCPLTPLEKTLRVLGGGVAYEGGFIRHYLTGALPKELQVVLASVALAMNAWIYQSVFRRRRAAPAR